MKDNELLFDRKSHVLYSKPCKKEILAKIALHYPEAERKTVLGKGAAAVRGLSLRLAHRLGRRKRTSTTA